MDKFDFFYYIVFKTWGIPELKCVSLLHVAQSGRSNYNNSAAFIYLHKDTDGHVSRSQRPFRKLMFHTASGKKSLTLHLSHTAHAMTNHSDQRTHYVCMCVCMQK